MSDDFEFGLQQLIKTCSLESSFEDKKKVKTVQGRSFMELEEECV